MITVEGDKEGKEPKLNFADAFLWNSTVLGKKNARDDKGSFMVISLIAVLTQCYKKHDLINIFYQVNYVIKGFGHKDLYPTSLSMTAKKLFRFNPVRS